MQFVGRIGTTTTYTSGSGTTNVADGKWHHVVGTVDNGVWKVYVDGQLESTSSTSVAGNFTGLVQKMNVGRVNTTGTTYTSWAKACIKEVSMWNYTKAAAEIETNFEDYVGYTGSETGLKGYWKVSEGSGTNYDDVTSQSNDLTTTGSPSWSNDAMVDYYTADVQSYSDYFPFGMMLPGRNGSASDYRYGLNGMEKDSEIKGEGNSYTTDFRLYDPRIGKWLSLDPAEKKYPGFSPYNAFLDNPMYYSDPRGDDPPQNFKQYTAAGGGSIHLPAGANVTTYSQQDYSDAVEKYGQATVDQSGIQVGQVKSFSFGSQEFNNKMVSPGSSGVVKSGGYVNSQGEQYKTPDISFSGGTLQTEMSLNFSLENTGSTSSAQVVQVVETTNKEPEATYTFDNGRQIGFVDGGVNSPMTRDPQYPDGVNPGEPYYIYTASNGGATGAVSTSNGSSDIWVYDKPNAQGNSFASVQFQTVIVATNFYGSGVDVVMGTYNWGFVNNSMTNTMMQTHQSNTVNFVAPTPRTMDIIQNDYPQYKIMQ
ncbi:MAG: hypothetical protein HYZ14_02475 [Bacteroidetes bacterium]|nr:hypothetical protein [Bacteroidota bacterium]